MPDTTQTYKNHARFFPLFHFVVMPIFMINFLNALRHVYLERTLHSGWEAVLAFGFVSGALAARVMALAVQDRVIRLEMRLRLAKLLPPDLAGRVGEISRQQFVALRFASDAELPDMVRDVLAGNLATQKAIKMRVKNWEGDYLRA